MKKGKTLDIELGVISTHMLKFEVWFRLVL